MDKIFESVKKQNQSFLERELNRVSKLAVENTIFKTNLKIAALKMRNTGLPKTKVISGLNDIVNESIESEKIIGSTKIVNYVSEIIEELYHIDEYKLIKEALKDKHKLSNAAIEVLIQEYNE
jgi:hypothetical protein